jgi:hypothetical protein
VRMMLILRCSFWSFLVVSWFCNRANCASESRLRKVTMWAKLLLRTVVVRIGAYKKMVSRNSLVIWLLRPMRADFVTKLLCLRVIEPSIAMTCLYISSLSSRGSSRKRHRLSCGGSFADNWVVEANIGSSETDLGCIVDSDFRRSGSEQYS